MTTNEFCYWLQGYFEINDADPNKDQNITEYQKWPLENDSLT